jgi:hypothetical protein
VRRLSSPDNHANWKLAVGLLMDTLKVGSKLIQVDIRFEAVPVFEERVRHFPLGRLGGMGVLI